MHWANIVNLAEIMNLLDENKWDFNEDDLREKWKSFLADHQEALEAYQRLLEVTKGDSSRRLLNEESSTASDDDANAWMKTWMQSFSSLMKDAIQGNGTDSSSILDTLKTLLPTDSVDSDSVTEISKLFKSLIEELTYKPQEIPQPTDVWGRMEQAMGEVRTLQRKATLTRSAIEAIETYATCRSDTSIVSIVSCLQNLTEDLQSLVNQYDADSFTTQRAESENSTLLESFRIDINVAMTTYTSCQEYNNIARISCLGDWWKSVREMEKKYANMDESVLSPSDASLLELLKNMLSLESYMSGTNPEVLVGNSGEERITLRELISNAINRLRTESDENTETNVVVAVQRLASNLRNFINNIGVFSRLGFTRPSSSGIKRKLLSEDQNPAPILTYLEDLNRISETIGTVMRYRNLVTDIRGQQTVTDRLQRLLALRSSTQRLTSPTTETLSSNFGRRVASFVLERIFSQASEEETNMGTIVRAFIEQRISERRNRKLLMEDPQLNQAHMQANHVNQTNGQNLNYLQRAFKEKATKSLKTLGEVKAMGQRKLHQDDEASIRAFLEDVRPQLIDLISQTDSHQRGLQSSKDKNTKATNALMQIIKKQETKEPSVGLQYMSQLVEQTIGDLDSNHQAIQTNYGGDLRTLDAILRRHFGQSLSEVITDAVATTRQVFKATAGIIAHDVHDHADRDGMPHERIHLTDLPDGSYEILSHVGKTAASLSSLQGTVYNYTKTRDLFDNADTRSRRSVRSGGGDLSRSLLAAYPDQGQSMQAMKSSDSQSHTFDVTADTNELKEESIDRFLDAREEMVYSDELDPFYYGISEIDVVPGEFMASVIMPELYGVSAKDFVDLYELERPDWWRGRTLYIPESQHLEYEFDFESQDDEAPVHKGLGALMKYHLLQDIQQQQKSENNSNKGFTMLEFIVFIVGIWTGLFIAFVGLGVVLLNRELSKKGNLENPYLTEAEARSTISPGDLSKISTAGIPNKTELSIKAAL
eukprot:g5346.t1